eukprot:jgi/Galph1/3348/GphlegSOOS_G2050.1
MRNSEVTIEVLEETPADGRKRTRLSLKEMWLLVLGLVCLLVFLLGFYLGFIGSYSSFMNAWLTNNHSGTHYSQLAEQSTTNVPHMSYQSPASLQEENKYTATNLETYERNGLWDKIANDVAVAIKTGKNVAKNRIPPHAQTWWKRIPNKIIIADFSDPEWELIGLEDMISESLRDELNITQLLGDADEEQVPIFFGEITNGFRLDNEKNLPGFDYLYKRYPQAKWYLMIDDDTFVFLDNLAKFLMQQSLSSNSLLYIGNPFSVSVPPSTEDSQSLETYEDASSSISFAHGGSGILLSGDALKTIVPHIPWCMKRWQSCQHGDARVALCLHSFDIHLTPKLLYFFHDTPQVLFDEFLPSLGKKDIILEKIPIALHHIVGEMVEQLVNLELFVIERERIHNQRTANEVIVTFQDLSDEWMQNE